MVFEGSVVIEEIKIRGNYCPNITCKNDGSILVCTNGLDGPFQVLKTPLEQMKQIKKTIHSNLILIHKGILDCGVSNMLDSIEKNDVQRQSENRWLCQSRMKFKEFKKKVVQEVRY